MNTSEKIVLSMDICISLEIGHIECFLTMHLKIRFYLFIFVCECVCVWCVCMLYECACVLCVHAVYIGLRTVGGVSSVFPLWVLEVEAQVVRLGSKDLSC